jgi:hypothetical protein
MLFFEKVYAGELLFMTCEHPPQGSSFYFGDRDRRRRTIGVSPTRSSAQQGTVWFGSAAIAISGAPMAATKAVAIQLRSVARAEELHG